MSLVTINVLGRVEIRRDGRPVKLFYPQQGMALAVLVAARGEPVAPETLTQSIWPDEEAGSLATIMSRLRKHLADSDLRITEAKGPRKYQLVGRTDGGLATAVDALRFEASWQAGRDLHIAGRETEALQQFRAAAAEWSGAPLDEDWGWRPPWICDKFRASLERKRRDLVRRVTEIALRRGGRYQDADFVRRPLIGTGATADPQWLVTVLTVLREQGERAARALIAARKRAGGSSDVISRAEDLVTLDHAYVDVHAPLRGEVGPRVPGSPRQIVGREVEFMSLAVFLAAIRDGQSGAMTVRGLSGVGKTRLIEDFSAQVAGNGVRMVTVSRKGPGELQPWRDLAGILWANSRRDIANGTDPLSPPQRLALAAFVTGAETASAAGHQRELAELALTLCSLLRQAAKGTGLIIVFDDADRLTTRGFELLREVRAGLPGVPLGWLLAGRDEGNWQDRVEVRPGEVRRELPLRPLTLENVQQWLEQVWPHEPTEEESARIWERTRGLPVDLCEVSGLRSDDSAAWSTGPPLPWLAAAAIVAFGLDIDPALVAAMLEVGPGEADRLYAEAVAAGPIITTSGVRFRHEKWRMLLIRRLDADPATKRYLHRRAFEVLSERRRRSADRDPLLPVRIAEHARGAGSDLPEEEVAQAFLTASRAERAGFGSAAAIGWASKGLLLTADRGTRFDLLMVLGDAQNDSGAMYEADGTYQTAYQLAAGQPRAQAVAAIALARRWSDPGQADDDLLHVLRSSLGGLAGEEGAEAEALRLQLTACLAHKSSMAVPAQRGWPSGSRQDGPVLARRALAQLRPGYPPMIQCNVLNQCRWGLYDYAPPTETLGLSQRLMAASTAARSSFFRSEALVALAIDQLRLGPISDAELTITRHKKHIDQNPRVLGAWLQGTLDTLVDLWHGRFGQAEGYLFGSALPAVQEANATPGVPADTLLQTWQGQVYWLRREQGRMREVLESSVADSIAEHAFFPIWRAALILACCDIGEFREAVARLTALLEDTDGLATFPRMAGPCRPLRSSPRPARRWRKITWTMISSGRLSPS